MSTPPATAASGSSLPENANLELEIDGPGEQRRVTVLFRLLLLIPQFIVVVVLTYAQYFVMFVSWFAALAMGRLPEWTRQYLTFYLRYSTRVNASAMLLVDQYPPFAFTTTPDYPVQIDLHSGRLNRLAVFFRLILVIPALIVGGLLGAGWGVAALVLWIVVLVTGRTPAPVFGATASVLRYGARVQAYFTLLTDAYPNPKSIFGEQVVDAEQDGVPRGTRPLVLTKGARILVIVFLVLGVANVAADAVTTNSGTKTSTVNY